MDRSASGISTAFVPPDRLRDLWPYCRQRLDRLRTRARADWLTEDVYHACMAGNATLHTINEAGRITGFFVLEQTQEFGVRSLHVWVCWHDGTGSGEVYRTVIDEFIRCAKACGIGRVRFSTHRSGWARKLEPYGFKNVLQILEMPL